MVIDVDVVSGTSLPQQSVVRMVEPYSTSSEYSKVALFLPVADGSCSNTGSYTVSLRHQDVEITALKMPDQGASLSLQSSPPRHAPPLFITL